MLLSHFLSSNLSKRLFNYFQPVENIQRLTVFQIPTNTQNLLTIQMFPNEIQTKPTKKNSKCHCTSFNHHQKNTHTHTHSHHKMRYFCHPIPLFILSLILFILFAALKRKFTTIFHITYIMLYVILCCCCRLPLHIIFLCFIICLLNVCIITLRNIYYIDIYFPQKKKVSVYMHFRVTYSK